MGRSKGERDQGRGEESRSKELARRDTESGVITMHPPPAPFCGKERGWTENEVKRGLEKASVQDAEYV